jgi:NTE family protein
MKKNVTLILSGGGARGLAHIGVIEELESRGYVINSIAGTSMGALVGGVYAAGKLNEFKEWMLTLDKQGIFRLIDFSFSSQGLIKGDRILKTMKKFVPDARIEELPVKYTATAFDIAQNKEIVFSEGNLYHAIRASISIPTVFTPVIFGKSVFVDGGVVNNIPIRNAIRTENDLLVASYVNADIPVLKPDLPVKEKNRRKELSAKWLNEARLHIFQGSQKDKRKKLTYFYLITNTIAFATDHLSKMRMQIDPPDVLIEISRHSAGTYDFFKAEELIEIGKYSTKTKFDSIN